MSQLLFDNSIGWAHFNLRGGWSRLWWLAGMFAVVAVSVVMAPVALVNKLTPGLQGYEVNGFLGCECFLCMLVIPAMTGTAIRNDLKEKMMESHPLMPVSGAEAIVGYLIGGNAIPLVLAAMTLIIGSIAAAISGVAAGRFLIASLVVIAFGGLLTIIGAYGAFGGKNSGGGWVIVALVPVLATSTGFGQFLPATAVFDAPFMRKTVFSMQAVADEPLAYVISELFGLLTGSLFFLGACRRYRSVDQAGFSPWMQISMVGIWIGASAVGMRMWQMFQWQTYSIASPDPRVQWAVAASIALFLSKGPVLQSVGLRELQGFRRRLDPHEEEKSTFSPSIAMFCCVLLILILGPVGMPAHATVTQAMLTGLIAVSFLCTMRFCRSVKVGTGYLHLSLPVFLIMWGGPPVVALGLQFFTPIPTDLLAHPLSACSAPIALYQIACSPDSPLALGLSVQAGVALAMGIVGYATRPQTSRPGAA